MQEQKQAPLKLYLSNKLFFKEEHKKQLQNNSCEELWLNHNQYAKIMPEITIYDFKYLKLIQFSFNFIDNMSFVVAINAPLLERLYVTNNRIVELRSIKRLSTNHLKILGVSNNYIKGFVDFQYLGLSQLDTFHAEVGTNFPIVENLAVFAKFNAPLIKTCVLQSSKRTAQSHLKMIPSLKR